MKRFLLSLFLFLSVPLDGTNHLHCVVQRSRQASIYFAPYHINGATPNNLEEFFYFDVSENPSSKSAKGKTVRVAGALHTRDGKTYKFESARFERDEIGISKLIFKTINIDRTVYRFEGTFLDRPELLRSTGNYTDLRGILARQKNGRTVARQELSFFANIQE